MVTLGIWVSWTASLIRASTSVTVVVRARCGEKRTACGKSGNAMFLVVGILRVLISKARQEACFRVSFLLVCIVRSWSHIFCLTQDTAGSERYEAMSRIYYRGARAAIVCYGKTLLFFNIP